jgi:hypothetical protein
VAGIYVFPELFSNGNIHGPSTWFVNWGGEAWSTVDRTVVRTLRVAATRRCVVRRHDSSLVIVGEDEEAVVVPSVGS